MSRVMFLGVPIDPVTRQEAVERISEMLHSGMQHHVMTPNNEMLVEATRNEVFRKLLNRTALNLPDSRGLLWAAKKTKQYLPERVTGVDTVTALCSTLDASHPVFLLGGGDGIAEQAAEKLQKNNQNLRIAGTFAGSPQERDTADIIGRINAAGPHLLLVAYGAPAQDLWIDEHLSHLPSVRVAIGVGGTFDFLAGIKKRAPKGMQDMGLEWLWRLINEPSRLPRILRATVVFPMLVMRQGKKGL